MIVIRYRLVELKISQKVQFCRTIVYRMNIKIDLGHRAFGILTHVILFISYNNIYDVCTQKMKNE
jgi:hypothetical protein